MSDTKTHAERSIDLAGKITGMAEDHLRSLDMTISHWPAEFRAIIWDAVALTAQSRAKDARGNQ